MLVKSAEVKKIRKQELEEERRIDREKSLKNAEARRKKLHEQEMVKQLFDNAVTWNQCILAKDYIAAIQKSANENGSELWVAWATQQIGRIEADLLQPKH